MPAIRSDMLQGAFGPTLGASELQAYFLDLIRAKHLPKSAGYRPMYLHESLASGPLSELAFSLEHSVVSLVTMTERREFSPVGSGVLISIGDERFIFTAAHVFEAFEGADIFILQDAKIVRPIFEGTVSQHPSGRVNDDRVDVAVLRLAADSIAELSHFIPQEALATDSELRPSDYLLLIGHPASRSHRVHNKTLKIKTILYAGQAEPTAKYRELGVFPESHIVIGFDKKTTVGPDGSTMESPHMGGASGGGVWSIRSFDDRETLARSQLEGLLIEQFPARGRHLVAVRIAVFLESIRHRWPKLVEGLTPNSGIGLKGSGTFLSIGKPSKYRLEFRPRPISTPEEQIVIHEGKVFSDQEVMLDSQRFINCSFNACTLVFRGSGPVHFVGCRYDSRTLWRLEDAAGDTIEYLAQMCGDSAEGNRMVKELFGRVCGEAS